MVTIVIIHWLRECCIVSQGWFRASPSCHTVKDLNVWVYTQQSRPRWSIWDGQRTLWNTNGICLKCPPQSTSEVMNWSQQMEQFGSSHSECKYCEQFQEWSAATKTIFADKSASTRLVWPHDLYNQVNKDRLSYPSSGTVAGPDVCTFGSTHERTVRKVSSMFLSWNVSLSPAA